MQPATTPRKALDYQPGTPEVETDTDTPQTATGGVSGWDDQDSANLNTVKNKTSVIATDVDVIASDTATILTYQAEIRDATVATSEAIWFVANMLIICIGWKLAGEFLPTRREFL